MPRCSRSWFLDVRRLWGRRGRWRRRRWWDRDGGLLDWEQALWFFYNRRVAGGRGRERGEHLPHGDGRLWRNYDLKKRREEQRRRENRGK